MLFNVGNLPKGGGRCFGGCHIFYTYTPSWLFKGTVDLVYVHRALRYFMKSIDSLYSGKDQDLEFMKHVDIYIEISNLRTKGILGLERITIHTRAICNCTSH